MNTFGNIYRLTSFGESHGGAIGGVIDGMPAGLAVDFDAIDRDLKRRRPGQSELVTARNESDAVTFLSGIYEGTTLGTPIGFTIANSDMHSNDYDNLRHVYRPSHADYSYSAKYGRRDHRGGGRSSARETAARIVAGSLASQALAVEGIKIRAYTSAVGDIRLDTEPTAADLDKVYDNAVRCPDPLVAARMESLIRQVRSEGDSIGGIITGVISGAPAGLGEPVFGKLHAMLASAMMSINAAHGFEYGMGFEGACRRGSEMLDRFILDPDGHVTTASNHSGGIQGGISNGNDIVFRVAFKPVATLLQDVATVNDHGENCTLKARGRHDPCVLPRAVPIVEAMAAMVMFDALLANRCSRIS